MRGECKYAHESRYDRYVDGKERIVVRTECWAEKEPFECTDQCREKCGKYKPANEENKLKWSYKYAIDGIPYKVCAKCGWKNELVGSNYCSYCGYEYEPWDGTTFR